VPKLKIAPAITSGDLGRLGDEVSTVIEAGADLIHVDILDGRFAPNITVGPATVAALRQYCTVSLDVHLLVADPTAYAGDFAHAGADAIAFPIETTRYPYRLVEHIKDLGCRAGVSLNPGTSEDDIEFVAEWVDYTVVLAAAPGAAAAPFIPDMLRKIQNVRAMMGEEKDVYVEGGIDAAAAAEAVQAGGNVLVPGPFVFARDSYLEAIETLKDLQA